MANNFQDGAQCIFEYQVAGGGVVVLGVRSSTEDIESVVHDVSTTIHKGFTARIGGKVDLSATLTLVFDLDTPPWANPPLLIPNSRGTLFFGLSANGFGVSCGVIISKKHFEQAVDKEIIYSVDAKMEIITAPLIYGAKAA